MAIQREEDYCDPDGYSLNDSLIKGKGFNRMEVHTAFFKRRVARIIDAILFVCGLLFLSTLLEFIKL